MAKEKAPKPASAPRNLETPYEWGDATIYRPPIEGFGSADRQERLQENLATAYRAGELPLPPIANRLQTTAGKTGDVLLKEQKEAREDYTGQLYGEPDEKYEERKVLEQRIALRRKGEELQLITGSPKLDENGQRLYEGDLEGGAFDEIEAAIKAEQAKPELGFFKKNFLTGRQQTAEYRIENMEIDKKALADRALRILGYGKSSGNREEKDARREMILDPSQRTVEVARFFDSVDDAGNRSMKNGMTRNEFIQSQDWDEAHEEQAKREKAIQDARGEAKQLAEKAPEHISDTAE